MPQEQFRSWIERHRLEILNDMTVMLAIAIFAVPSAGGGTEVPKSCFRSDGLIDLVKCKSHILQVPNEILDKGYYNSFGEREPGLLSPELRQFDAGVHVEGNILRMNNKLTWADVEKRALEIGLDVSKLKGGMATDSARYLGTFAWLRPKGSTGEFYGPVFVTSSAATVHKRQRACKYGTVGEVNTDVYKALGGTSGPLDVEVVFTDTNTFDPPNPGIASGDFVNYSAAFLAAAEYVCP